MARVARRRASSTGDDISVLGFGCMRFARKAGRIDQEEANAELDAAFAAGVNYFDTAYIYPGSEEALGAWMTARKNRDQVHLATKLPYYLCRKAEDFDRIFNEQLERLQTTHVDYYLIHMITSYDSWKQACDLGIEKWIADKKAAGQIKHIGFSFHGSREDFRRVVDAFSWEFCMIQLNYLDAGAQAGLEGLRYASAKGLPVFIMEPLRGGRLANNLPRAAQQVFRQADPKLSNADWSFRWLFNLPEVTCVLSGMNSREVVQQNCALASGPSAQAGSLSAADQNVYDQAIAAIRATEKVGCTGCGYCLPCPKGVDIPTCFRCYNEYFSDGWFAGLKEYVMTTALKAKATGAGACVGCGRCARHCPQHIDIPAQLGKVQGKLEGMPYKGVRLFSGVLFKR